eukprot:gene9619-biopygen9625
MMLEEALRRVWLPLLPRCAERCREKMVELGLEWKIEFGARSDSARAAVTLFRGSDSDRDLCFLSCLAAFINLWFGAEPTTTSPLWANRFSTALCCTRSWSQSMSNFLRSSPNCIRSSFSVPSRVASSSLAVTNGSSTDSPCLRAPLLVLLWAALAFASLLFLASADRNEAVLPVRDRIDEMVCRIASLACRAGPSAFLASSMLLSARVRSSSCKRSTTRTLSCRIFSKLRDRLPHSSCASSAPRSFSSMFSFSSVTSLTLSRSRRTSRRSPSFSARKPSASRESFRFASFFSRMTSTRPDISSRSPSKTPVCAASARVRESTLPCRAAIFFCRTCCDRCSASSCCCRPRGDIDSAASSSADSTAVSDRELMLSFTGPGTLYPLDSNAREMAVSSVVGSFAEVDVAVMTTVMISPAALLPLVLLWIVKLWYGLVFDESCDSFRDRRFACFRSSAVDSSTEKSTKTSGGSPRASPAAAMIAFFPRNASSGSMMNGTRSTTFAATGWSYTWMALSIVSVLLLCRRLCFGGAMEPTTPSELKSVCSLSSSMIRLRKSSCFRRDSLSIPSSISHGVTDPAWKLPTLVSPMLTMALGVCVPPSCSATLACRDVTSCFNALMSAACLSSFLDTTLTMPFAFDRYRRVLIVSSTCSMCGDTVPMTTVFEFPPSDSERSHVRVDSRYGGIFCFPLLFLSIKQSITRRRVVSDKLMDELSSAAAALFAVEYRSEPARSTKLIRETVASLTGVPESMPWLARASSISVCVTVIWKMAWLLLLLLFAAVAATVRSLEPLSIICRIWLWLVAGSCVSPSTYGPLEGWFRTRRSWNSSDPSSKSRTFSVYISMKAHVTS